MIRHFKCRLHQTHARQRHIEKYKSSFRNKGIHCEKLLVMSILSHCLRMSSALKWYTSRRNKDKGQETNMYDTCSPKRNTAKVQIEPKQKT